MKLLKHFFSRKPPRLPAKITVFFQGDDTDFELEFYRGEWRYTYDTGEDIFSFKPEKIIGARASQQLGK